MIKGLLLNRWKKNRLPHFFILRGEKEKLTQWTRELLKDVISLDLKVSISQAEKIFKQGVVDILEIQKSKEKATYNWSKNKNDFEQFGQFLSLSPIILKKKIVLLHDGHLLTTTICNKLLMTLEEATETLLIFLNPTESPMLPTIESRAITLRPIRNDSTQNTHLIPTTQLPSWIKSYLQNRSKGRGKIDVKLLQEDIPKILEGLKNQPNLQEDLLELLLDMERHHDSSYLHKKNFLEFMQWFQKSSHYNNSYRERFFNLLSLYAQNSRSSLGRPIFVKD
jgi:hypothetical protein